MSRTHAQQPALRRPQRAASGPRVIAEYVKKRHVLTLEEAVRKMTSWPATRMRLANRGLIKEGQWAFCPWGQIDGHVWIVVDGIDLATARAMRVVDQSGQPVI